MQDDTTENYVYPEVKKENIGNLHQNNLKI